MEDRAALNTPSLLPLVSLPSIPDGDGELWAQLPAPIEPSIGLAPGPAAVPDGDMFMSMPLLLFFGDDELDEDEVWCGEAL